MIAKQKAVAHLKPGDVFTHCAKRYTVTGEIHLAEMMPHTVRLRIMVPTDSGILNIPTGTLMRMV